MSGVRHPGRSAPSGVPREAAAPLGGLNPGVDSPAQPGVVQAPASLVRMANQIASNAAHKPHDVAVARTADHLREFWHPSMIRTLEAYVAAGGDGLGPIAAEALAALG
jgi:formate dehydrogenase subunit delta